MHCRCAYVSLVTLEPKKYIQRKNNVVKEVHVVTHVECTNPKTIAAVFFTKICVQPVLAGCCEACAEISV